MSDWETIKRLNDEYLGLLNRDASFMSNDEIFAAIEYDMPACVWEHEDYTRLLTMIRELHARAKAEE